MTSNGRLESEAGAPQDRWRAPVRYLRGYPEVDLGPRGFPFYICEGCGAPLQGLPRTSAEGIMLVCVWGCGQRYWVDDQR
ncbi:MAG: hypothetical protein K1X87_03995 [Dehalococcoidia bacterium]|nr:hypothetical protein [Dehalococcoidia bacterium]